MKKFLALILTAALTAGTLTACGSTESTGNENAPQETETAKDTQAAGTDSDGEAETVELQAVTIAATAVPHAEILEAAKPIMAEQGWDLQITVFDDYIQPNEVVEAGDIDCNFFQHIPYLDSFNMERGTHLVNAGEIHYEPLGIYAGTESDLTAISEGATIAIPNDTTNEARALLLLQDNGIITLKAGAGINATINDIEENPHNVEFIEMEAAQVSRILKEVSFAVINGNYALDAGLNALTDAIASETSDSEAAKTYVNIIVVREGNEENEGVKALVEVLKSDDMQKFIEETYEGSVVPFV